MAVGRELRPGGLRRDHLRHQLQFRSARRSCCGVASSARRSSRNSHRTRRASGTNRDRRRGHADAGGEASVPRGCACAEGNRILMRAKVLMVMGTASDVGKSVVVTALCRAFARSGVRVAPFKSQNMSNNAAVCPGGGEIGRAQAVQAEACGLEPGVDMTPVLLKPESESGCQVVIRGRPRFHMKAREHEGIRAAAWPEIVRSYEALAENFDLIVIEG